MQKIINTSEWLELEEQRGLFGSASDKLKKDLGLQLEEIDGIVCSISSAEPSILINRCFVTIQEALLDVSCIQAVIQAYKKAGVGEFFMHVPDSNDNIRNNLQKAGMKQSRGWMKFKRDTKPAVARNPELTIREIGPELAEAFARIVVPCFDLKEASVPLIAGFISDPNCRFFMGFDGDTPAATGGLFYRDGYGYCDFGATHRDFRGRGFQGALLAHRINEAINMGAKALYTATGEAVPGDPQHSYKNILRYGFTEYYLRENWVPV